MVKVNMFPSRSAEAGKAEKLHHRHLGHDQLVARDELALGCNWTLWNVVKVLVMVVRLPVFLVLYFMRAPVMVVCSVLYLPLFLLALFAWYAFPEKPQMWAGIGVISLVSFVLMYVYDLVLSWLSPHELVRTL